MRDLVSGVERPLRPRSRVDRAAPRASAKYSSPLILAGIIGGLGLLAIGLAWLAPLPAVRALPPLPLPAAVASSATPASLAASAGDVALARPLFAVNRRPVAVAVENPPLVASSDRISGIIQSRDAAGAPHAIAVMQPKDGAKPVTLHVGDRFHGALITAIDDSGVTLAGGARIAPQFGPAGTQ